MAAVGRDRIFMRGMQFFGRHGVLKEETALGQKFLVDLTIETSLAAAAQSDSVADTIDYAQVYADVKRIVEGSPRQLIETVADDIARVVLQRGPRVHGVNVKVTKPHVALSGHFDAIGVDIYRHRELNKDDSKP